MSVRAKLACATAPLAAVVMLAGSPARTEDLPAAPVADAELDDMRGGFVADGIQFNFGAILKTTVDGQLAFQTQVTWTATGAQVSQTLGPNTTQGGKVVNGQINGLDAQGLSQDQIAKMNNGATVIIHNTTGGAVQNILLNTASGVTVTQSTQVNLGLPGFAQTQQAYQQGAVALQLLRATQAGLTPLLGR
jgi:hypothetical protein